MGFPWITRRFVPPARLSAPLGEDPAFSPRGELVAWLPRRPGRDLVERERVFVERVATGEELCSLPGPGIVRALRFVSSSHLFVVRDGEGGSRLTLHELPLGEVVAEHLLAAPKEHRPLVELSPDLATVLLHGPWGNFSASGPVVALDARTLAPRWQLSELEVRALEIDKSSVALQLHPDGARLALLGSRSFYDPDEAEPTRVFVGPPMRPWASFEPPQSAVLAFQWSGRDELVVVRADVGEGDEFEGESRAIAVARAPGAGRLARVLLPPGERAHLARFSPDGSRLLCVRAAERPTVQLDEDAEISFDAPAPMNPGACSIFRVDGARCVLEYQGPTNFVDTFLALTAWAPIIAWNRAATSAAVLETGGDVALYTFDVARWSRTDLDVANPVDGYWGAVEFVDDETLLLRSNTRAVQLVSLAKPAAP